MSSKNVDDDMLSTLPDEIISHILSLMPTNFAARTSVLSQRWRYMWMYVTNLDFDDFHPFHGKRTFSKFVDRVMKSCKSSQIQLFRLHFSHRWVQNPCVSYWIDKAVGLNVCEFDIHANLIKLPSRFFNCKTLTKLSLHSGHRVYNTVRRLNNSVWRLPCQVNLPCLKTLDIAIIVTPIANVFKLIHGCPMLEDLSLEMSSHNKELKYTFNIPTLRRLNLNWEIGVDPINIVVLNVPNLEYLYLSGKLCSIFVMEDLSSLVQASVSFYTIRFYGMWIELLKYLSNVKSFSVEIPGYDFGFRTPITSRVPIFPNTKHLELKGLWNSKLIPQILKSFPKVEHLCIEQAFDLFLQKPEESGWVDHELVPACMLTNLTTLKYSIYKGWTYDIELLEYMLGNAEVLKKVTIIWQNPSIEEEEENLLSSELFKLLPTASKCYEMYFRGIGSHAAVI